MKPFLETNISVTFKKVYFEYKKVLCILKVEYKQERPMKRSNHKKMMTSSRERQLCTNITTPKFCRSPSESGIHPYVSG